MTLSRQLRLCGASCCNKCGTIFVPMQPENEYTPFVSEKEDAEPYDNCEYNGLSDSYVEYKDSAYEHNLSWFFGQCRQYWIEPLKKCPVCGYEKVYRVVDIRNYQTELYFDSRQVRH